mmetsp:Transcript_135809/g.321861  ORF Transcript_135809/g.321861 Transcript_135809/m.321861 type:complete len:256 (-) Transcript_135809:287-1054(-)
MAMVMPGRRQMWLAGLQLQVLRIHTRSFRAPGRSSEQSEGPVHRWSRTTRPTWTGSLPGPSSRHPRCRVDPKHWPNLRNDCYRPVRSRRRSSIGFVPAVPRLEPPEQDRSSGPNHLQCPGMAPIPNLPRKMTRRSPQATRTRRRRKLSWSPRPWWTRRLKVRRQSLCRCPVRDQSSGPALQSPLRSSTQKNSWRPSISRPHGLIMEGTLLLNRISRPRMAPTQTRRTLSEVVDVPHPRSAAARPWQGLLDGTGRL